MTDIKELNDEELSYVIGGIGVEDEDGNKCSLVVGDVITITNYIMPGTYCLVKIESSGTHRFLDYTAETFTKKGISFSKIPTGSKVVKVGHDQQFVDDNLVGGMVI